MYDIHTVQKVKWTLFPVWFVVCLILLSDTTFIISLPYLVIFEVNFSVNWICLFFFLVLVFVYYNNPDSNECSDKSLAISEVAPSALWFTFWTTFSKALFRLSWVVASFRKSLWASSMGMMILYTSFTASYNPPCSMTMAEETLRHAWRTESTIFLLTKQKQSFTKQ